MKTYFTYLVFKFFNSLRSFELQGHKYKYFTHRYNRTWRIERQVEIPIIWDFVKKHQGKRVLEVGNVLSHYFSIDHDVLDKHERGRRVINQDVVNFKPRNKYDLIVSISTLEHVGWDEKPRNPEKILKAIKNLKNLLGPKGKIIVTLPLGYNQEMDKMIDKKKIRFPKQYYLKRITNRTNQWQEVKWQDIRNARYNSPFPGANGLIVGMFGF